MDSMKKWWDERSEAEKWLIGGACAVATIATGGALAYAIATGGVVVASNGVVVAARVAATALAKRV